MGQSDAEEEEWEEYPILIQRRSFMGYSNRKAVFSTGTMINDSHLTGPGLIISCWASFPLLLPCFTGRRVTDCPSTRIGFHVLMGGGVYETKLDYKEWTTITTTTTTIQLRSVWLCLVSLSKWPNVEYKTTLNSCPLSWRLTIVGWDLLETHTLVYYSYSHPYSLWCCFARTPTIECQLWGCWSSPLAWLASDWRAILWLLLLLLLLWGTDRSRRNEPSSCDDVIMVFGDHHHHHHRRPEFTSDQ